MKLISQSRRLLSPRVVARWLHALVVFGLVGGCLRPRFDKMSPVDGSDEAKTPSPSMKWPPPLPSAFALLQPILFEDDHTLYDVAGHVQEALARRGYSDMSWYIIPNGFAVVTRCERISDTGAPLDHPRFSSDIERIHEFSLRGMLSALFRAPRGRFRVLLVAVTSDPASIVGRTDDRDGDTLTNLSRFGGFAIPEELNDSPRNGHSAFILFYELSKRGDRDLEVVHDGALTSADEVTSTGLGAP